LEKNMRIWIPLLGTLAMACGPQPELEFTHLSTMESKTRGVVLMDDGQRGHGAMVGTTCRFDTLNGWLIDDFDLPTRDDRVTDTLHGDVLGTNPEGVYEVRSLDFLTAGDVRDARFTTDGIVTVEGVGDSCAVSWAHGARQPAPPAVCDAGPGAITVVRATGAVVVATPEQTVVVDADGARGLADAADFAVYDKRSGLVYLAMEGQSEVRAVDLDGELAWHTDVGGGVTAMQQMGKRNKVVVMVEDGDGTRMVVLDGPTGEEALEVEAPGADVELSVSDDGSTLAVTLPNRVFFYDVIGEGESPKRRTTLGAEDRRPVFSD
jgi:hypothetical protein